MEGLNVLSFGIIGKGDPFFFPAAERRNKKGRPAGSRRSGRPMDAVRLLIRASNGCPDSRAGSYASAPPAGLFVNRPPAVWDSFSLAKSGARAVFGIAPREG